MLKSPKTCYPYMSYKYPFLGAFAKLRKAAVSFVMSVCPNGVTRLALNEFSWNLTFECLSTICRENSRFVKIWQELRVLYTKSNIQLWSHLLHFFLEWKMFQSCREKQNEQFTFNNFFFKRVLYERMYRNSVQPDRPQTTIWRRSIACWITRGTNTDSECVTFTMVARTRLSVTLYTHCLSFLYKNYECYT
jgi:hypothetical protein